MCVYICKYGYTYMYYILIASIFFIPSDNGKFLLNYSTLPHKTVDILTFLISLLKKNMLLANTLLSLGKFPLKEIIYHILRLDLVQMLYI